MFEKFVIFEIEKKDTTKIVDALSVYARDLKVKVDSNIESGEIYIVDFHCKQKNIEYVMDEILKLNREGVNITRLAVY